MIAIRHRNEQPQERDPLMKLRNVLNIIFMAGALVGVAVYILGNQTVGIYIVLGAMVFKLVESGIRIFHT